MKKIKKNKNEKDAPEGLFVPAGLLTGMGLGFLYNQLVAGLFIGLGIGFFCFAIISVIRNRK